MSDSKMPGASAAVITAAVATAPPKITHEHSQQAVAEFFRANYQSLIKSLLYAGASMPEAEDAVSATMSELLVKWETVESPTAWARRAVFRRFVKNRDRDRERRRREALPAATPPSDQSSETDLNLWENSEWVLQLLRDLTPAQRDIVALLCDEFTQKEIAEILGKTPAAVRQTLAAARNNLRTKLPRATVSAPLDGEAPAAARSEL